jgi:hypothetical protein
MQCTCLLLTQSGHRYSYALALVSLDDTYRFGIGLDGNIAATLVVFAARYSSVEIFLSNFCGCQP